MTRKPRWTPRIPHLLPLLFPPLAIGVSSTVSAQQPIPIAGALPVADALPAEARQFDFWVGEWDVNLRVIQDDLSWKDARRAAVRIYPILSGKAVLELWDETDIKGFSLRYFDTSQGKWVLWLNWPGRNRSGSSSLEGVFRHGRGDFFSIDADAEGAELISRYSFNDITPTSLRWDDAYSRDGGKTWSHQWIMEFSRTADLPELPAEGGEAHTFHTDGRCDQDQFRRHESLSGRREGSVETGVGDGGRTGGKAGDEAGHEAGHEAKPAALTGYRVLDGCAVLVFVSSAEDAETADRAGSADRAASADLFAQITFNTYAGRYELLALDADPDTPARVYHGPTGTEDALHGGSDRPGPGSLVFVSRADADHPAERVRIDFGTDGAVVRTRERGASGSGSGRCAL